MDKKENAQFWFLLVLGIIGAIYAVILFVDMAQGNANSTIDGEGVVAKAKQLLPLAIALTTTQFITLAISVKMGGYNVIAVAIVYAIIIAVIALIMMIAQGTLSDFNFGVFIALVLGAVVIALVAVLVALPIYVFAGFFLWTKSVILSAIIYLACAIAVFSFGVACILQYPWIIAIIIAIIAIVLVCMFKEESFDIIIISYRN